jgi:D-alanyl-D-alanine carboxypeptidase/D-alanyl-D-alanine-endopeptidase (penicillin-binding protein 4)
MSGRLGHLLVVTLLVVAGSVSARVDNAIPGVLALPGASLVVEERGRVVIAHQGDRPMVPASTLKLVTALAAIDRWGLDHRSTTGFFVDDDGWLWVQGSGDPFLVSEELDVMVEALRARGIRDLAGIATDTSRFAPGVEIAGRSASDNPYDAPVSALAVNFNTLNVTVSAGGRVASAESQTPLTPLALSLSKGLAPGRHRINLGEEQLAPRYFAEVLAAKLRLAGVAMGGGWRTGRVPEGLEPVYLHLNSRDLRDVLSAMLEYSNNFIANQLFMLLGDDGSVAPLTMAHARQRVREWAEGTFGWTDFRIDEGAGLSRNNRLSARQLVTVVKAFAPYRDLLPAEGSDIRAKTGTLSGVSCYAGFVRRDGDWVPFGLMINQPASWDLRLRVARDLVRSGDLAGYCSSASC